MKNDRTGWVRAGLIVCLLAVFMSGGALGAYAAQPSPATADQVTALAGLDDVPVACVVTAGLDWFAVSRDCGEDQRCTTEAAWMLLVDVLECSGQENEQLDYFLCATDAFVDILDANTVCKRDTVCLLQQMLPAVLRLVGCGTGPQPEPL